MFIFKNAFISIMRNKGRNILIGLIILVIACACTITLAINNTASDLIASYSSAYDKELTISFDRKNMMGNFDMKDESGREEAKSKFDDIETYTVSDVKSFADSDYIKSYYYTYSLSLNGKEVEKVEVETPSNQKERPNDKNMDSYDFTLTGYSSYESMSEFINGTYTMSEITDDAWDIAFDGNYVFINEELASYNELSLNDKITLESEDGNTYEFEIIGIFKDNEESDSMMSMFSNSANTILTNANALIDIKDDSVKGTINPTFIINDYDDANTIQDEFYEKGLDENYVVETNQEVSESGVSSIKNVKSFATTFLIITLIIGGVVLFVINMINIRERKYEIGVLRTIGVSKLKLTMQFVVELLIVSIVFLLIGAGVGATMSKQVSNSLLSSEIENSTNSMEKIEGNFGGMKEPDNKPDFNKMAGTPNIEAYDSIDAVVNITVILELFAIGILLVIVSSLASMISIQRFSPLTILKERS